MQVFSLTMRIEEEDDITPSQIAREIYDGCDNTSFAFDIVKVFKEEPEDR